MNKKCRFKGQLRCERNSFSGITDFHLFIAGNIFLFVLLTAISIPPVWAEGLTKPDCGHLGQWAAKYIPKETIQIAPKVAFSAFLKDEWIEPLFGKSFVSWDANDFSQVRKWLKGCRRAALKRKDKKTAGYLYQAMMAVNQSRRPLSQMVQVRKLTEQKAQWIMNYHLIPELPKLLALAQMSLKGEDVQGQLKDIQLRGQIKQHVADLRQARDYLGEDEISALIQRFTEREAAVKGEMKANDADIAAAKKELAAVPNTNAGLSTLDRLAQSPVLRKMSAEEATAFQQAIQKKRWAISQAQQQRAARKAAIIAAKPIALEKRLNELFVGKDVEDLSIRGLRPGIQYSRAKEAMTRDWRFGSGAGGDVFKEFAPKRSDLVHYKDKLRRDGGVFRFETMEGKVGQIRFIEHYMGPLKSDAVRTWLIKRFGKPDNTEVTGAGPKMTWEDDGSFLQITIRGRTIESYRQFYKFRSSIVVTMWSKAYKKYLEKAEERCRKLRNKPIRDLSIADREALLTGCKTP